MKKFCIIYIHLYGANVELRFLRRNGRERIAARNKHTHNRTSSEEKREQQQQNVKEKEMAKSRQPSNNNEPTTSILFIAKLYGILKMGDRARTREHSHSSKRMNEHTKRETNDKPTNLDYSFSLFYFRICHLHLGERSAHSLSHNFFFHIAISLL